MADAAGAAPPSGAFSWCACGVESWPAVQGIRMHSGQCCYHSSVRLLADRPAPIPSPSWLSRLFPGRGLMLGLSDYLIDLLLPKRGTFRPVSGGGPPPGMAKAAPAGNGGAPAVTDCLATRLCG